MSSRQRCAVSECRHAPWAHRGPAGEQVACRLCACPSWLAAKPHRWRLDVWDAWFLATTAWLTHRESVAVGYPTEQDEFEAHHPRPRLADFMAAMSPGVPPEELVALYDFDVCVACSGTGHQTDARPNEQRRAS